MKLRQILMITIILFTACNKMDMDSINKLDETIIENNTNHLKSFAVIMSKALYNETDLREFIKNEALKKRDLDFDVFYPWVKDVVINNGQTFESVIKKYDSNNELDMIIKSCPLLTILVPDWSWVNEECFCVTNWDTDSPDVGVSFLSESDSHEIFHNGEYVFTMNEGEYSTAPILIIKNNERITCTGETKSGDVAYYFNENDYICPEVQTKGSIEYETIDLEYESTNNVVSTSKLTGRVATVYNTTNNSNNIPQRDYIYYGMTSSINQGTVNKNYYENLYKIRISPSAKGIFDDPVGGSSTGTDFKSEEEYLVGRKETLSEQDIISRAWGEGSIDIKIKVYAGGMPILKMLSVTFAQAFDVKQVTLKKSINWLGAVKSRTYYLDITSAHDGSSCLEPRWVDVDYDFFFWDASIYPMEYYVEFWECDAANSITKEFEHTYNYMTNFTTNAELSAEMIKLGWSTGATETRSNKVKYSENYTEGDDEFGNFVVQYSDKIILSQNSTNATIKIYKTGYIDAMIIPCYE